MKHEDKLQYIRKAIKCLDLVEERLRHRPEDKELVAEIKQATKNLRNLLRDAREGKKFQDYVTLSLLLSKAIDVLKFIGELLADVF